MSDDDDLLLEFNVRPWDTAMPPTMYPVPVAVLPSIPAGEKVTVRAPGPIWVIDELMVDDGPITDDAGEAYYLLLPVSEPGAGAVRPAPPGARPGQIHVFPRRARAEDMWIYRDTPGDRTIDDLPVRTSADWLDRVGDGSQPPVRQPRPSRELPLLTGQRVRAPDGRGGWVWYVAVSEPIDRDGKGDIRVAVLPERQYWESVYGHAPTERDPDSEWIIWPPLHVCWTY